jgi:hypothetical protein
VIIAPHGSHSTRQDPEHCPICLLVRLRHTAVGYHSEGYYQLLRISNYLRGQELKEKQKENCKCDQPHEIRTNLRQGRNVELICHNCGRIGGTHVNNPPLPFSCRSYEGEKILPTTFEAWVYIKNWPTKKEK